MRVVFVLLAAGLATTAAACPPPIPPLHPPTLEETDAWYRDYADIENIVYATVDRAIPPQGTGRQGRIRILHVYKGAMRVGQRVAVTNESEITCGMIRPWEVPRGHYGVLRLGPAADVMAFEGFMAPQTAAELIRRGLIGSAAAAHP